MEMQSNGASLLPELKFFSIKLHKSYKIGERPANAIDPIIEPEVQNFTGDELDMKTIPEIVFENLTALFRFDNGQSVLVHWPLKDVQLEKSQIDNFLQGQLQGIQAQLYKAGSEIQVRSYDISKRRLIHYGSAGQRYEEPTDDSVAEYAFDTFRYTAAQSIFEKILRGFPAAQPYGISV